MSNVTVLKPKSGWQAVHFRELWEYRELAWFLAMRDIKVRYKQTLLGGLWAVIQPLFSMIVFSVFFGYLAGLDKASPVNYQVSTFCALLPWQLFANAVTNAGNSLVANANLISKVYFPRLVVPISTILTGLVDFAISFGVLLGLMAWYKVIPTAAVLTLPLFVLLAVTTALAVGLWLSALNVEYRDVRYTLGFLTQIWMFASPVAYPANLVREKLGETAAMLYGLNPMVGVIEGFRWCLLGTGQPPGMMLWVSVAVTLALLVSGLYYFRRMEKTFADLV